MKTYESFFLNISDLIGFTNSIFTIATFLLGFLFRGIIKYFRNYKIRKVLSIKNHYCQITLPKTEANVYDGIHSVILENESILNYKIIKLLTDLNIKTLPFFSDADGIYSEICIGGPIANKNTYTYLNIFFPSFTWNTLESGFTYDSNEILKYIPNVKDYAILIKLLPGDLGCKKTVHILFGGTPIGATKSVEFFTKYYELIYRQFKTSHYFIAIPIKLYNNSFDLSNGILNLTFDRFK